MARLLLIFFVLSFPVYSFAQSDYLLVKKRSGRTVKSFIVGSPIVYQTVWGNLVNGPIISIRNDTVSVRVYDIRPIANPFGLLYYDTVGSNVVSNHYRDIQRIRIYVRRTFLGEKMEQIMLLGGAGYAAINILNGAYFGKSFTESKNLRRLAIPLAAFATGLILRKVIRVENYFSTKRHRIIYVRLPANRILSPV
jgi:hypothetical protein